MPIAPKRMPFISHVGELRRRLTVVIAVVGVLTIAGYFFSDQIYAILIAPMRPVLGHEGSYVFDILEAMTVRFRLGMYAALVVGSPIIIYEVLAFFLPALKPKERKWFMWTFAAAAGLFIIGVAFCYFLILQASTQWLVDQSGATFNLLMRAQSAITFAMWFLVGFGLAFEVPVVVFYLVYFNVVPYDTLAKNWRTVWVVIVIVASMITPDWNPWSLLALSAAMIFLFQSSLLLVRILLTRKIKAQALPEVE